MATYTIKLIEKIHEKKQVPIWVLRVNQNLKPPQYKKLNDKLKKEYGAYYSRYINVRGWVFKTEPVESELEKLVNTTLGGTTKKPAARKTAPKTTPKKESSKNTPEYLAEHEGKYIREILGSRLYMLEFSKYLMSKKVPFSRSDNRNNILDSYIWLDGEHKKLAWEAYKEFMSSALPEETYTSSWVEIDRDFPKLHLIDNFTLEKLNRIDTVTSENLNRTDNEVFRVRAMDAKNYYHKYFVGEKAKEESRALFDLISKENKIPLEEFLPKKSDAPKKENANEKKRKSGLEALKAKLLKELKK